MEPTTLEKIKLCAPEAVALDTAPVAVTIVTVVPLIVPMREPVGTPVPWMVAPTTNCDALVTTIELEPLVRVQLCDVPVNTAVKAMWPP